MVNQNLVFRIRTILTYNGYFSIEDQPMKREKVAKAIAALPKEKRIAKMNNILAKLVADPNTVSILTTPYYHEGGN